MSYNNEHKYDAVNHNMTKCNWCHQEKAPKDENRRTVPTCPDCEKDPRYIRYLLNRVNAAYDEMADLKVQAAKTQTALKCAEHELKELKMTPEERAKRDADKRQKEQAARHGNSDSKDECGGRSPGYAYWRDLLG